MNADKFFTILGSIVVLATVTVVLSSPNTSKVIGTGFSGFSGALRTAMGRG
jgi:hypothetical protein